MEIYHKNRLYLEGYEKISRFEIRIELQIFWGQRILRQIIVIDIVEILDYIAKVSRFWKLIQKYTLVNLMKRHFDVQMYLRNSTNFWIWQWIHYDISCIRSDRVSRNLWKQNSINHCLVHLHRPTMIPAFSKLSAHCTSNLNRLYWYCVYLGFYTILI